jgi:predicted DNA-binding transcriptional regulator YafY
VRSNRLIALVMLCRTRAAWTATELAQELGVSVRTIYRDVAALQEVGVPLWTEPGPGGGVRLLPGWTALDNLTGDEAAALSLSGVPSAVADLGLGAVAMSAQLKVRSTLPADLRARAERAEARFLLDAPGWFRRPEELHHLPALSEATWSDRRVRVTYRRGDRSVTRTLDPLGLVLKAGTWYLVAAHRGRPRSYRVSRVTACRILDAAVVRPEDFELSDWWSESTAEFERTLLTQRCRLAIERHMLQWLPHVVDPETARDAIAAGTERDDGWVELELWVESAEVAVFQLCAFGGSIEVLEPEELRSGLVELGRALAERNATPSGARLGP